MSERHIRIVQLYPFGLRDIGGVASSFRLWAEGLAATGTEVIAVTAGGPRPPATEAQWVDLAFRRRGPVVAPVRLAETLRSGDVLVLHSAWSFTNALAARTARRAGIPYVVVPHGGYAPSVVKRRGGLKRSWATAIERPMLRGAAAVQVFFEEEIDHLRALGYRGAVIVAPNGIDPPPVEQRKRDGYLLWWGRLDVEHKGIDLLVEAVARSGSARLVMHGVGSPAEGAVVADLIGASGAADRISLRGPVRGDDKWDALAGAAAFAFPSRWDAHSIAVMEAAAAGIPVVATDTTIVAHHLARADAAICVSPNPDSLAAGIDRALSPEGDAIGARARTLARDRFAPERVAVGFLEQLRALL